MTMFQLIMYILNTILIIIAYCSIFNFISMVCSEVTISTTINIVLFIAMFIAESSFYLTASSPKYITNSYWENGVEYIISQEPNANYPGDDIVNIAKKVYLSIPNGQARELSSGNSKFLYEIPFYCISLIIIINVAGIFIFSKKELK